MTEQYIQKLEDKACELVFSATQDKEYDNQLTQQLIFLALENLMIKANVPNLENKLYRLLQDVPISIQKDLEKPGIHRNKPIYRRLLNKKYFQKLETSILIRDEQDLTNCVAILAHETDHGFHEGPVIVDHYRNQIVYRTGLKIVKGKYESTVGLPDNFKVRNAALEELCTIQQSDKMRLLAFVLKNVNLKYLSKFVNQLQPQSWYLGYPVLRMIASGLFLYLEPMLEEARLNGNVDYVANIYNQTVERENAFEQLNKRLDRLCETKISRHVQGGEAMQELQTQVKRLETKRLYQDIQNFNMSYREKGYVKR